MLCRHEPVTLVSLAFLLHTISFNRPTEGRSSAFRHQAVAYYCQNTEPAQAWRPGGGHREGGGLLVTLVSESAANSSHLPDSV